MAKIAFWITAGPDLRDKALANLILAGRLKTHRNQDVEVYFFGPGVRLASVGDAAIDEALATLTGAQVPLAACPANADQYGVTEQVSARGITMELAGEALVRLVEQGYQIVGG